MLTINEIVKEQMIQTISKEDSEVVWKQKMRECVLHIPYVKTEGFVRATACYTRHVKIGSFTQAKNLLVARTAPFEISTSQSIWNQPFVIGLNNKMFVVYPMKIQAIPYII